MASKESGMLPDSTGQPDGATGGTDLTLIRPPSSASTRSRRSRSSSLSKLTFEEALKHLFSLEKKLREETAQNIRELKVHTTQKRIDIVAAKANYLFNVRQQLKSSKNLYKEEETIMREFAKMKSILAQKLDDDDWDRAKGDCKFLGGKLNDVRSRQRNLSGQVEDLEDSIQDLLTSPMDDLDNYDLEQLKREEAEFDANVPSFLSYPLFNSAPYGRARVKSKQQEANKAQQGKKHSNGETSNPNPPEESGSAASKKESFNSWLAKKEAELKQEQNKRFEDEEEPQMSPGSYAEEHQSETVGKEQSLGCTQTPTFEENELITETAKEVKLDLQCQKIPVSPSMEIEASLLELTSSEQSEQIVHETDMGQPHGTMILDSEQAIKITQENNQVSPTSVSTETVSEIASNSTDKNIRIQMEILDAVDRVKEKDNGDLLEKDTGTAPSKPKKKKKKAKKTPTENTSKDSKVADKELSISAEAEQEVQDKPDLKQNQEDGVGKSDDEIISDKPKIPKSKLPEDDQDTHDRESQPQETTAIVASKDELKEKMCEKERGSISSEKQNLKSIEKENGSLESNQTGNGKEPVPELESKQAAEKLVEESVEAISQGKDGSTFLEDEQQQKERIAQQKAEEERLLLESQGLEQKGLEEEAIQVRLEEEKNAKHKAEEERLLLESQELEQEKLEEERIAKEKAEEERIHFESQELEQKRLEEEAIQVRLEEENNAKHKAEEERLLLESQELEHKKLEEERITQQKAEEERLLFESQELEQKRLEEEAIQVQLEEERIAQQKAKEEKLLNESQELEQKRLEEEAIWAQLEEERVAQQKAEEERLLFESQKLEQKRLEEDAIQVQLEEERIAQQKVEEERLLFESKKLEQKRLEEDAIQKKLEEERIAHKKAEEERLLHERKKLEEKRLEEEANQIKLELEMQRLEEEALVKAKQEEEKLLQKAEEECVSLLAKEDRIIAEFEISQKKLGEETIELRSKGAELLKELNDVKEEAENEAKAQINREKELGNKLKRIEAEIKEINSLKQTELSMLMSEMDKLTQEEKDKKLDGLKKVESKYSKQEKLAIDEKDKTQRSLDDAQMWNKIDANIFEEKEEKIMAELEALHNNIDIIADKKAAEEDKFLLDIENLHIEVSTSEILQQCNIKPDMMNFEEVLERSQDFFLPAPSKIHVEETTEETDYTNDGKEAIEINQSAVEDKSMEENARTRDKDIFPKETNESTEKDAICQHDISNHNDNVKQEVTHDCLIIEDQTALNSNSKNDTEFDSCTQTFQGTEAKKGFSENDIQLQSDSPCDPQSFTTKLSEQDSVSKDKPTPTARKSKRATKNSKEKNEGSDKVEAEGTSNDFENEMKYKAAQEGLPIKNIECVQELKGTTTIQIKDINDSIKTTSMGNTGGLANVPENVLAGSFSTGADPETSKNNLEGDNAGHVDDLAPTDLHQNEQHLNTLKTIGNSSDTLENKGENNDPLYSVPVKKGSKIRNIKNETKKSDLEFSDSAIEVENLPHEDKSVPVAAESIAVKPRKKKVQLTVDNSNTKLEGGNKIEYDNDETLLEKDTTMKKKNQKAPSTRTKPSQLKTAAEISALGTSQDSDGITYDVPKNNQSIYDVPRKHNTEDEDVCTKKNMDVPVFANDSPDLASEDISQEDDSNSHEETSNQNTSQQVEGIVSGSVIAENTKIQENIDECKPSASTQSKNNLEKNKTAQTPDKKETKLTHVINKTTEGESQNTNTIEEEMLANSSTGQENSESEALVNKDRKENNLTSFKDALSKKVQDTKGSLSKMMTDLKTEAGSSTAKEGPEAEDNNLPSTQSSKSFKDKMAEKLISPKQKSLGGKSNSANVSSAHIVSEKTEQEEDQDSELKETKGAGPKTMMNKISEKFLKKSTGLIKTEAGKEDENKAMDHEENTEQIISNAENMTDAMEKGTETKGQSSMMNKLSDKLKKKVSIDSKAKGSVKKLEGMEDENKANEPEEISVLKKLGGKMKASRDKSPRKQEKQLDQSENVNIDSKEKGKAEAQSKISQDSEQDNAKESLDLQGHSLLRKMSEKVKLSRDKSPKQKEQDTLGEHGGMEISKKSIVKKIGDTAISLQGRANKTIKVQFQEEKDKKSDLELGQIHTPLEPENNKTHVVSHALEKSVPLSTTTKANPQANKASKTKGSTSTNNLDAKSNKKIGQDETISKHLKSKESTLKSAKLEESIKAKSKVDAKEKPQKEPDDVVEKMKKKGKFLSADEVLQKEILQRQTGEKHELSSKQAKVEQPKTVNDGQKSKLKSAKDLVCDYNLVIETGSTTKKKGQKKKPIKHPQEFSEDSLKESNRDNELEATQETEAISEKHEPVKQVPLFGAFSKAKTFAGGMASNLAKQQTKSKKLLQAVKKEQQRPSALSSSFRDIRELQLGPPPKPVRKTQSRDSSIQRPEAKFMTLPLPSKTSSENQPIDTSTSHEDISAQPPPIAMKLLTEEPDIAPRRAKKASENRATTSSLDRRQPMPTSHDTLSIPPRIKRARNRTTSIDRTHVFQAISDTSVSLERKNRRGNEDPAFDGESPQQFERLYPRQFYTGSRNRISHLCPLMPDEPVEAEAPSKTPRSRSLPRPRKNRVDTTFEAERRPLLVTDLDTEVTVPFSSREEADLDQSSNEPIYATVNKAHKKNSSRFDTMDSGIYMSDSLYNSTMSMPRKARAEPQPNFEPPAAAAVATSSLTPSRGRQWEQRPRSNKVTQSLDRAAGKAKKLTFGPARNEAAPSALFKMGTSLDHEKGQTVDLSHVDRSPRAFLDAMSGGMITATAQDLSASRGGSLGNMFRGRNKERKRQQQVTAAAAAAAARSSSKNASLDRSRPKSPLVGFKRSESVSAMFQQKKESGTGMRPQFFSMTGEPPALQDRKLGAAPSVQEPKDEKQAGTLKKKKSKAESICSVYSNEEFDKLFQTGGSSARLKGSDQLGNEVDLDGQLSAGISGGELGFEEKVNFFLGGQEVKNQGQTTAATAGPLGQPIREPGRNNLYQTPQQSQATSTTKPRARNTSNSRPISPQDFLKKIEDMAKAVATDDAYNEQVWPATLDSSSAGALSAKPTVGLGSKRKVSNAPEHSIPANLANSNPITNAFPSERPGFPGQRPTQGPVPTSPFDAMLRSPNTKENERVFFNEDFSLDNNLEKPPVKAPRRKSLVGGGSSPIPGTQLLQPRPQDGGGSRSASQSPNRMNANRSSPLPDLSHSLPLHIPADKHLPVKLTQDPLSRPDYGGYASHRLDDEAAAAAAAADAVDDASLENTELYKRLHEGLRTVENLILSSPFHQEAEFGTAPPGQETVGTSQKYSQNLGRAEFGTLRRRDNSVSGRDKSRLDQPALKPPLPAGSAQAGASRSRDPSRDRQHHQRKTASGISQQSSIESNFSRLSDNNYPDLEATRPAAETSGMTFQAEPRTRRANSFGPSQAVLEKKKAVMENIAQRKQAMKEAKHQMLIILLLGLCICIMIYLQTEEF